jgi:sulfoxide reductase catalytic subunit YedY
VRARPLSRRQFARLVLAGVGLPALGSCAPGTAPQWTATASPRPPPQLTPTPSPAPAVTAAPGRQLLRNDNVPGFFVRYYQPFEAIDPESWTLSVDGLVHNPLTLSLADVLALPRAVQTSRMKCVECWSAVARWEGFHLRALMDVADPLPEATWLHSFCADDYFESMSIDALLGERVLFVHHMNDAILPDIYGAPLRLMVPFLYGYKSAKAIVHIKFAAEEMPGYWPTFGPYSRNGQIRPGADHPLDLEGTRRIEGDGEIFYPDGIESTDQGGG